MDEPRIRRFTEHPAVNAASSLVGCILSCRERHCYISIMGTPSRRMPSAHGSLFPFFSELPAANTSGMHFGRCDSTASAKMLVVSFELVKGHPACGDTR
jgi:hypothetical protein